MSLEGEKRIYQYRLFYAILGWLGILAKYILMLNGINESYGPFHGLFELLKLFSVQVNLLVLLWVTMAIRKTMFGEKNILNMPCIRGAMAVYMTLVLVMTPISLIWGMDLQNQIIHIISRYIIPGAYMVDWLLTQEKGKYRYSYIIYWIVYPVIYGSIYIIHGILTGNYVYDAINVGQRGYRLVVKELSIIALSFIVVSALYIFLNKMLKRLNRGDSMTHKIDPKHKHKLDNEWRRENLPPREILEDLGLSRGDVVADIGSGIGYFAVEAAKIVGEDSKVYALDISKEMLDESKKRASKEGIDNIENIVTDEYDLKLEDDSVGFAFLSTLIHEVDDKNRFLREVRRILKEDGKIAIVDFQKKNTENGPPIEHRVSRREVIDYLMDEGFEILAKKNYSNVFYGVLAKI